MRQRRRALAKYVLPIGAVGLAAAPALATGAPATFAAPVNYALSFVPSRSLAIGDFSADGNLDVAVGGDTGGFSIFPGAGDGTLGSVTSTATSATGTNLAISGDLTNDSLPDLYFTGSNNESVIALNQTSGGVLNFASPIAPTYLPAPQGPGMPSLGDLNEDGKLDVVQPGYNGGLGNANSVIFRLGNGDGTFGATNQIFTNPTPGGEGGASSAIADVNGDGHLDVLAGMNPIGGISPRQGAVVTALGNGNGTFQSQQATTSLSGASGNPSSVVVADVNGDGDPDVLIDNNSGGTSVLLGNGDGTFQTAVVDASLVGYSLTAADLNGDGVPDLATADYYGHAINVALGNGDGSFATATPIPVGSTPYSVAAADMNGDGLKDLVTGHDNASGVSVLINTSVAMPPTVTSVAPANGPDSGGTSVTITGTGFTGATAVTFGGVSATSFTVNSPTSITAVAPPHAAGTVAIDVTTANGTGTGAGLFTYTPIAAPNAPDGGAGSSSATAPAESARPSVGRLTMATPRTVAGRTVRSTGVVPAGATRVVQTATGGASSTARTFFGAWATARAQTSCPISTRNGRSTFSCTLRLAPGRWTVTTRALSGSTTVAKAVSRVRVTAASRLSVTG